MTKPRHRCDACGERDGKVEPVVLQVAGKAVWKRRLCLMCRTSALQRFIGHR